MLLPRFLLLQIVWFTVSLRTVNTRPSRQIGREAETLSLVHKQKSWLKFDPTAPRHAIARTERNLRQPTIPMSIPMYGPHYTTAAKQAALPRDLHRSSHHTPHEDHELTLRASRRAVHPTDVGHSILVDALLRRHASDGSMPQRRKVNSAGAVRAGIDQKAYQRILRMTPDAHIGRNVVRGIDGCVRTNYGHGYEEGKIPGSCLHDTPAPFFQDSSHQLPGSADNTEAIRYGLAVLNMDNGTDWEVFIGGFGTPNIALKWNRTKIGFDNFARDANLQANKFDSTGVVACDLDGDGTEELYVLNTGNLGGDEHIGDHIFKRQFKRRKGEFTHVPFYTDLLQHRYDNDSKIEFEPTSMSCVDIDGSGIYHVATANFDQATLPFR